MGKLERDAGCTTLFFDVFSLKRHENSMENVTKIETKITKLKITRTTKFKNFDTKVTRFINLKELISKLLPI